MPSDGLGHGLRTPGEEIFFTAWPKIHSQSQIFRYGRSIFCLPHRPKFSDCFDLCLHWVSVVIQIILVKTLNFDIRLTRFRLSRPHHDLQYIFLSTYTARAVNIIKMTFFNGNTYFYYPSVHYENKLTKNIGPTDILQIYTTF